jgi:hypothetical protein
VNSAVIKNKRGRTVARATGVMVGLTAVLIAVGGAVTLGALTGFFGLEYGTANRVLNAIEAGTDAAAALSLFGGVTAAGGFALWMLKKAIMKGGKKVILG